MAPAATRPRRRHRLRAPIIALVVLLAVAVGVDRISVQVADSAGASTIQHAEHLAIRPSAAIGGFPFLTQFASATFGRSLTFHR